MGILDANRLPPGLAGWIAAEEQGRRGTAANLNTGMGILQMQNFLRQADFEDQLKPLQIEQARSNLQKEQQRREMLERFLNRSSGGGILNAPGSPLAFGAGGMSLPGGGQENAVTGESIPPAAATAPGAQRGILGGIQPGDFAPLALAGVPGVSDMMKAWELENPRLEHVPGIGMVHPRSAQVVSSLPRITDSGRAAGAVPDGRGGWRVQVPAGSVDAYGQFQQADEAAKARYDMVEIPGVGRMSRLDALNQLSPGQPAAPGQPPAPAGQTLPGAMVNGVPLSARPPAEQTAIAALHTAGSNNPMSITVPGRAPGYVPTEAEKAADRERAVAGAKRESEAPQAGLRAGSQLDDLDRLTGMANQVLKAPGLDRAVGLFGALPSVPGGKAADAESLVESLRSQVSAMKLAAMRAASPTGGAVGNVTEKEWPRLESMISALNPKASPALFRQQVSGLVKEIQVSKQRIQDAYTQEFGKTPGAVAPRSRSDILKQYEAE